MLPRETSERQLKMLRKLTKGTDIGDITAKDRLNHNVAPNLQYIGNPVDTGIDSYEDFTEKDSKLQTIAFKSKLVNKPLVKENKEKIMEKKLNNVVKISETLSNKELKTLASKTIRLLKNIKPIVDDEPEIIKEINDLIKEYKKLTSLNEYHSPNYEPTPLELSSDDEDIEYIKRKKIEDQHTEDDNIEDDNLDNEDILNFENFKESENYRKLPIIETEYDPLEIYKLNKLHKKRYSEEPEYKDRFDRELDRSKKSKAQVDSENARRRNIKQDEEEGINRFSDFAKEENDEEISIAEATKYEFLGKEEEPKSNPNFGYAAVRDQEIKKIGAFTSSSKLIDPKTPKERPVLNAGQFIDNEKVKGYVNRVEGKDVYVESLEEPMVIKKFSLKDAIKIKKEE